MDNPKLTGNNHHGTAVSSMPITPAKSNIILRKPARKININAPKATQNTRETTFFIVAKVL